MTAEVFDRVGKYYDDLVARHGNSPRACDYGRPESQQNKFRVVSQVANLSGKRILDVGCGLADYATFLSQRFQDVKYVGVDISASMIAEASRLHPTLDIRCLNILDEDPGTFDIVTANGVFYLLGLEAPALMRRIIERMFECAKEAVAFTSLSKWASDPEQAEFYADPLDTLAFCRSLTPWVALRHDYHSRDFTIYMYRVAQQ